MVRKKEQNRVSDELTDLIERFPNMRVEVLSSPQGHLLFVGKIDGIKNNSIQVSDVDGEKVPPVEYNTPVKLRGNTGSSMILLDGKVSGSAEQFWLVDQFGLLNSSNRRSYFRQNINLQAKAMLVNAILEVEGQKTSRNPSYIECQIQNISAVGVMFASKENFQKGDKLCLKNVVLVSEEPPIDLNCIVRRRVERSNFIEYGCEFYDMDTKDQDRLIKEIFILQRTELRAKLGNR